MLEAVVTCSSNSLHAGKFSYFFCYLLIIFSKSTFSKDAFKNTIRVSNSLDKHFVMLDLGPNCLQRLSADDTGG